MSLEIFAQSEILKFLIIAIRFVGKP
jgi:hypothetical protein